MGFETAALLIAAAGSAATLYQQEQNVKAEEKYNKQQSKNALEAMNENIAQIGVAQQQAGKQAAEKKYENNLAAQRANATAQVSAGEAGVAGLSVDALLSEIDADRSRYNDSITANLADTNMELNSQRANAGIGARSQINSLKTPKVPDYAGAALRIGGALNDYRTKK